MESTKNQELKELVHRLQNGDEKALSKIYDDYSAALFGLINRIVPDKDAAGDVLQDSFVKIWKYAPTFSNEKGSFFTWMLNICRNSAIDALRKTKKEQEHKNQILAENVSNPNQAMMNVNAIGLSNLVNKLPEDQRIIIEYLYFKGYTQQELADELNLPLGTVKTRARNAVLELKNHFVIITLLWIVEHT